MPSQAEVIMRGLAILAVSICLASVSSRAATLRVPDQFPTIQAAVDAAVSGDRVLVASGDYDEHVLVPPKRVHIESESGAEVTTVSSLVFSGTQWNQSGGGVAGFTVTGSLSAGSIDGFVLRNCAVQEQVTIWCYDPMMAYVEVDSCTFWARLHIWGVTEARVSFCSAPDMGISAILLADIDHCDISGGALEVSGGWSGYCYVHRCSLVDASLRINGCLVALVSNNIITSGNLEVHVTPVGTGGADVSENVIYGGGIAIQGELGAGAHVMENTVHGCLGGGITIDMDPEQFVSLARNIVTACERGVVWVNAPDSSECACNDVWGNAGGNWIGIPDPTGLNGNLSVDPLFCDPAAGDLTLASESPCLPGSPLNGDCGQIGALGQGCEQPAVVPGSAEPVALVLCRAVPNPFSAETVLFYRAPAMGHVTAVRLDILDSSGRVVRCLRDQASGSGICQVRWDGLDGQGTRVPSGVYWSCLRVGDREITGRIVRIQ